MTQPDHHEKLTPRAEKIGPGDEAIASELAELAQARLRANGHGDIRRLVCSVQEGTLILHGCVTSFFHKQLAQEAMRDIPGHPMILNQIEVVESDGNGFFGSS